jgi:O-antigen ligase
MPFAAIGTSAYIIGFAVPFNWDFPLVALGVCAVLSIIFAPPKLVASRPPMLFPLIFFLGSIGASAAASINLSVSVYLSVALLPAVLIYFLLSEQIQGADQIRLVFLGFSAVSLVISLFIIVLALSDLGAQPSTWISRLASPILVVPNDTAFLAVLAPLSIALFRSERDCVIRAVALASAVLGVVAICILRSRTGLLTMVVSTTVCVWFIRPRLGLLYGIGIIAIGVMVDGFLGFPLLAKFGGISDRRLSLWLAAWDMFRDAPILGQGPHTYGLLLHSYVHDLDFPNWQPLADLIRPWPWGSTAPWPHNLYFEVLAEHGAIGFVAFMTLLLGALRPGWKLRDGKQVNVRAYGTAAVAGLLGFCFAAILELSFIRVWVTVTMLALIGVIACLVRLETTLPGKPSH